VIQRRVFKAACDLGNQEGLEAIGKAVEAVNW